ncbi:MAG: DUF6265 family protein [Chitinophagales bacterium]
MSDFRHIDDLFRQHEGDFDQMPSDALWDKLSQQLPIGMEALADQSQVQNSFGEGQVQAGQGEVMLNGKHLAVSHQAITTKTISTAVTQASKWLGLKKYLSIAALIMVLIVPFYWVMTQLDSDPKSMIVAENSSILEEYDRDEAETVFEKQKQAVKTEETTVEEVASLMEKKVLVEENMEEEKEDFEADLLADNTSLFKEKDNLEIESPKNRVPNKPSGPVKTKPYVKQAIGDKQKRIAASNKPTASAQLVGAAIRKNKISDLEKGSASGMFGEQANLSGDKEEAVSMPAPPTPSPKPKSNAPKDSYEAVTNQSTAINDPSYARYQLAQRGQNNALAVSKKATASVNKNVDFDMGKRVIEKEEEGSFNIPQLNLENHQWLLGEWTWKKNSFSVMEDWQTVSKNHWVGYAYTHNVSGDFMYVERLTLTQTDAGKLVYTLKDEVAGTKQTFYLVEQNIGEIVFQNQDVNKAYPKTITYALKNQNPNHLTVTFEGTDSGKPISRQILLSRN